MTERELLTAGLRELGVAECPSAADNLLRYSSSFKIPVIPLSEP